MKKCEICGEEAKYIDVRDLNGVQIKHYYCEKHVSRQKGTNLPIGISL